MRATSVLRSVWRPASGVVEPRVVSIVGAPMHYGQPRAGTEGGPKCIRDHGA